MIHFHFDLVLIKGVVKFMECHLNNFIYFNRYHDHQSPSDLAIVFASLCFEYIELRTSDLTLASAATLISRLCSTSSDDLNCWFGFSLSLDEAVIFSSFSAILITSFDFASFSFFFAMGFSARKKSCLLFFSVNFLIRSLTI